MTPNNMNSSPFFLDGRLVLAGNLILNDQKELLLLFRDKYGHWETPGGKMEPNEASAPVPTRADLWQTALRELHEEIGAKVKVKKLRYFGQVKFSIPDGRLAIVHKFLVKIISGRPVIGEPEIFSRLEYLPLAQLQNYPLSPDLKLLLPQIQKELG